MMHRLAAALVALALSGSTAAAQGSHQCSYCHVVHSAPGPTLNLAADVEVLCQSCHGPAGISTMKAAVHTNASGSFNMGCIDCHTPHNSLNNWLGGTNLKQIGRKQVGTLLAKIATPNSGDRYVTFESRGPDHGGASLYSFADSDEDGNGTFDGVCEVCHTTTSHHTNSVPDTQHYTGQTCTACHPHVDNFMPTGGSCTACHAEPQDNGDGIPIGGRRAVVGELAMTSHHVSGVLEDGDCVACHDQSKHQKGYVRIKNVDDPSNMSLVAELHGDPMTNALEAAKLEPLCLACHDQNGAADLPPFSGGAMPPVVDSTAWSGASHAQLTCFGDGLFGCHSSGHGSAKENMLAPFLVAATAPDFAEQEEGFCTNCHDGSVASTDLAAEFQKGTNGADIFHHPIKDSEQVGTRTAECTLCHNPHAASSTDALAGVAGIDLAGNPVGHGTANVRAITEYELCFTCHGDDYNASLSGTSNKRTDFDPTNSAHHSVAGPGRNTSSNMAATLIGGLTISSTLTCADCHNSEATSNVDGLASNSSASPQGPHGSTNAPILRGYFWSNPVGPSSWNESNFELCFKCHDVSKMFLAKDWNAGARTNFMQATKKNLHNMHARKEAKKKITCANCHWDVHSNQNQGGNTHWMINGTTYTTPPPGFKTRLVSFSPDVTGAGGMAVPTWWLNTSTRERRCYVDCHGESHKPEDYRPTYGDDDSLLNN